MAAILLLLEALLLGIALGQQPVPAPGECVYSFHLAAHQVKQICGPQQNTGPANNLKADYDQIKAENQALKDTVEKLRQDYEGMVAGVLKMERETAAWREVVAWPNLEPSLKPDNSTVITVDSPAYKGKRHEKNTPSLWLSLDFQTKIRN